MIIHSKEHDYYDTADPWRSNFHWKRPKEKREIIKKVWNPTWALDIRLGLDTYDNIFIVGFCGSLYHGIKFRNPDTLAYTYKYERIPELDVVNTHKLFAKYPFFILEEKTWSSALLYTYPVLKDWEFYKVKDAFTAHQEIERFLTNEMANQLDGVELKETEAQTLERHGFTKCTFKGKHTGRKLKRR